MELISNSIGKVKKARLNGREYLVAPMTLLVEGVLAGSQGPLFYPAEEITKDPSAWNGMPLLIEHPTRNNKHVSGRNPRIIDEQGVGWVFGARAEGNKLVAEGWFDVEKLKRLEPSILTALQQGKPIELSTGLYTENEPAPRGASYKGRPYHHIARNYRPDHVAILPKQVGACSIADGCGVLANSTASRKGTDAKTRHPTDLLLSSSLLVANPYPSEHAARIIPPDKFEKNSFRRKEIAEGVSIIIGKLKGDTSGVMKVQSYRFDASKFSAEEAKKWLEKHKIKPILFEPAVRVKKMAQTTNAQKYKTEDGKKFPASDYAYVPDPDKPSTWKLRLTSKPGGPPDPRIVGMAIAALGEGFRGRKVQIPKKDLPKVKAKVRAAWLKANPDKSKKDMPSVIRNERSLPMNEKEREELIDQLISNCSCWDEEDREVLNALSDEKLIALSECAKHEAVYNSAVQGFKHGNLRVTYNADEGQWEIIEEPAQDDKPTANTLDEWLEQAPEEVKQLVYNAQSIIEEQKQELIDKLTANLKKADKERVAESLKQLSVEQLKALEPLANTQTTNKPVYTGSSGPVKTSVTNKSSSDSYLPLPRIDWGELAKSN